MARLNKGCIDIVHYTVHYNSVTNEETYLNLTLGHIKQISLWSSSPDPEKRPDPYFFIFQKVEKKPSEDFRLLPVGLLVKLKGPHAGTAYKYTKIKG